MAISCTPGASSVEDSTVLLSSGAEITPPSVSAGTNRSRWMATIGQTFRSDKMPSDGTMHSVRDQQQVRGPSAIKTKARPCCRSLKNRPVAQLSLDRRGSQGVRAIRSARSRGPREEFEFDSNTAGTANRGVWPQRWIPIPQVQPALGRCQFLQATQQRKNQLPPEPYPSEPRLTVSLSMLFARERPGTGRIRALRSRLFCTTRNASCDWR